MTTTFHPHNVRVFAIALAINLTGVLGWGAPASAEDSKKIEFFETRIRPVLVKHCYECHSADAEEPSGGLLVDSAAGLRQGGDSGPAVVAGKPDESVLLDALRYEGMEMPPAGRLPDAIIEDFTVWIKQGAVDPRTGDAPTTVKPSIDIEEGRKFWAFQPVQNVAPPDVQDTSWPRLAVDRFVLARLESAGLKPSVDVNRRSLARRLYFDLVGLPPTPEQIAAFLSDASPNAVENLVDRLLDSPQFGIHWGRHWLDVARYADSNGGDFNATFHDAWKYRDYVVRSFNTDKPYDQFVREQIAGDLLPYDSFEQRTEQVVATGFLMAGAKMLSERDKEKLRMDVVDEQLNTVGEAFMAMTLGCARCHDHKFDPIPTRDYYALAGIFRSTSVLEGESQRYVSTWPRRELPADPDHVAAVARHEQATKALQKEVNASTKELELAQAQMEKLQWNGLTVDDAAATLTGNWKPSTYTPRFVGVGYIHDEQQDKGKKVATFSIKIPKSGKYQVCVAYAPGSGRAANVPVTIAHAEGEETVELDQTRNPDIENLFASVGTFRFEAEQTASVSISNRGTQGFVIVDAVRWLEVDEAGNPVPQEVSESARQEAQEELNRKQSRVKLLQQRLKELKEAAPPPLPTAFAVADHQEIGDCEIRIRGEHRNLGPRVPRGFLQVAMTSPAPTFTDQQSGRRELAEWIASPEHPLTARVMVNRIWYHLIGEGIVASLDNFGQLGARPTHPELLDYLAREFMANDWSVKHVVRQIAISRTYAMASDHNEQAWEKDPENTLLWRAHRRRLPAEAIRDSLLAVADGLDLREGGSPVEGLGVLVTTNDANTKEYSRQTSLKRSLYLPIIRNELPPILTVFDFADPDLVTGKRAATNVPAQALLLMNSPFVIECAQTTAELLIRQHGANPAQLVAGMYERILAREPGPEELDRSVAFLTAGAAKDDKGEAVDGKRLAQLVQVLFSSTEFRFLN